MGADPTGPVRSLRDRMPPEIVAAAQRLADEAPPFTPEQIAKLRVLFAPTVARLHRERAERGPAPQPVEKEKRVPGEELTPAEVAREFNVSPATVRRWEASGVLKPTRRLPNSRHRRYSRATVDALRRQLAEGGEGSLT